MKHKRLLTSLVPVLLLLLTACSGSKIKTGIEYGKFSMRSPFQSTYTKDGAYIFMENNVFFYKDGQSQFLFSTNIVDDKPERREESDGSTINFSPGFNNYVSSKALDDLYIMGERLYYISRYESSKGDMKYYLSSVNLLGKDRIDHILIKDKPFNFYMADDYFIIGFNINDEKKFLAYDKDLKEHDLKLDGKMIVATYKSMVFYSKPKEKFDMELWVYDLKTGQDSFFAEFQGDIACLGEGYIAMGFQDQADGKWGEKLYSIEDRKEIFREKGCIIFEIDSGKFYATDESFKNYYEYDITGKLLTKVNVGTHPNTFHIIAVRDRQAILNSNKAHNVYYHIDFKTQEIQAIEVK